jgi:hypothetical protein
LKTETYTEPETGLGKLTIYAITIVAVLLIGYILVRAMRSYVPAQAINAKRVEERIAARDDVRNAGLKELNAEDYAVINPANGVVRLPISRAMQLTIEGLQNPAAFRSNMNARVENATKAPPAPVAPAAPAFE